MMNQPKSQFPYYNFPYSQQWPNEGYFPPYFLNNYYQHSQVRSQLPFQIQQRDNVILYSREYQKRLQQARELKKMHKKALNSRVIEISSDDQNTSTKRAQKQKSKNLKFYNSDQKEGRNANSNLLRTFFRRIQFKIKNGSDIISKVIQKASLTVTREEFLAWYQANRVDHRNYIRLASTKKLFDSKEKSELQYSKIMRILLQDFLQKQAVSSFLTSKKTKKEAMVLNLASVRSIPKDIMTSISQ